MFTSFAIVVYAIDAERCLESQAMEWRAICLNCEVENCASCKDSGINGCDKCDVGYLFSTETNKCEDSICRVRHCEDCSRSDLGLLGCN